MNEIKLLDHGYVKFIEAWGSDQQIVESARMSTNKGFKGWDNDEKFLRFLWDHSHLTPFEMAGCIIEVKAPIFVFREWYTHRTQSRNEMSARYTPLPDESYVPSVDRLLAAVAKAQDTRNKQEQSLLTVAHNEESIEDIRHLISDFYHQGESLYQHLLSSGIPKELARIVVSVGRYSKMRSGANLRNWLAFLKLREAENAQWEIRQYACAVHTILEQKFPRTMKIFEESK